MAKAHIIETAHFNIAFGREEDAFEQQAELGSFFRRSLLPVVDELFSERADSDGVFRIETLEVDLGEVKYSEYKDELPRRLREELRTILAGMRFGGQDERDNGSKQLTKSNNERQQIEYFLLHGHLPWHATLHGEALEVALKKLLDTDVEWFTQFIATSPESSTIITRLIWQFSTAVPLLLVQRLSPALAAMALSLSDELEEFWNGYAAITQRPSLRLKALQRQFWYLTIVALLDTTRSLSTRQFFERVMSELLVNFLNIKSLEVSELLAVTPVDDGVTGGILQNVMRDLFDGGVSSSVADENQRSESGSADEQALHDLLIRVFTGADIKQLTPLWARLVNDETPLLESVLRQHGQQAQVRNHIAFEFPESYIRDIVQILEPVEHGFITAVVGAPGLFRGEVAADTRRESVSKKQLWQFSLSYLLAERGSRFNRKAYLGSLIRQMAAHDNMSYQQLLAEIRHSVAAVPGSSLVTRQMQQLLAELVSEHGAELGQKFTGKSDRSVVMDEELLESCDYLDALRGLFSAGGAGRVDELLVSRAIDTLVQRQPWLLLQLYRQLQAGVMPWQAVLDRLSVPLLQKFITAFLGLMQSPDMTGRSDLLDAIIANAERSQNLKGYYRHLLSSLLAGEMIDFDAIMLKSRAASEVAEGSASMNSAEPVRDAVKKGQGTEALDLTHISHYLSDYLSSGEIFSASQIAALINTFELFALRQPKVLSQLLESLLMDKRAMARLIDLLPERLLARCLPLLGMTEHGRLLQCAELVTSACYLNELVAEPALLPRLKWQFIFSYLGKSGRLFTERDFAQHYVEFLAEQTRQTDQQTFRSHLSQQLVQNILPSTRDATIRIIEAVTDSEALSRQASAVAASIPVRAEPPAISVKRNDSQLHEVPLLENIYISNAGMVLATPYLPRLFQMLGLTENSAFINRDAQVRAVHLLQFMVNGQSASPEYLLMLNKLLCGIKSGHPIELSIEIGTDEKNIIEGLLQGIIQNWKVLGNTSIAGLRESFLQREGRLQLRDDAWHLLVEPRSFDMLLDQIPWGYSTIKYPWMERVIYVEWR